MQQLRSPTAITECFGHIICSGLGDGDCTVDMSPCSTEAVVHHIDDVCASHLGVAVDLDLLRDLVGPVCIFLGVASPFVANTILRSELMVEIVGETLSRQLIKALHAEQFGAQPVHSTIGDTAQLLLTELVQTRQELSRLKVAALSCRDRPIDLTVVGDSLVLRPRTPEPPKKHGRNDEFLTSLVKFAVECKVAFRNTPKTIADGERLIANGRYGNDGAVSYNAFENLRDRWSMGRHALVIDAALDMHVKDVVAAARDNQSFLGFTFTSDESPSNSPRYISFRFQVTFLHLLFFYDVSLWTTPAFESEHPFRRERHMCDIVNCAGKRGIDVLRTLDKQFSGKGVSRVECCGGTGDGGGENEGVSGVHALMEAENGHYVRRRCFAHISWRVFEAGHDEMGERAKGLDAIHTYLHDGVTWTSLQAISVQSREDGGLQMYVLNGERYVSFFGKSPPRMQDQRPELTKLFLQWLVPRFQDLAKLAEQDIQVRRLKLPQAAAALACLKSRSLFYMLKIQYTFPSPLKTTYTRVGAPMGPDPHFPKGECAFVGPDP